MKGGIGIDDWKAPIFRKHLTEAGYKIESELPGPEHVILLTVLYTDRDALEAVIVKAVRECYELRPNSHILYTSEEISRLAINEGITRLCKVCGAQDQYIDFLSCPDTVERNRRRGH